MNYNVYKGTKEEFENCNGEIMLENSDKNKVKSFCKKHGIKTGDFFDDFYSSVGENQYWLVEAN